MIRDIKIRAVANGYIADVGCQTFVFESITGLLQEVGNYLRNPEEAEKTATLRFPNMRFTLGNAPATPGPLVTEGKNLGVHARIEQEVFRERRERARLAVPLETMAGAAPPGF